MIRLWCASFHSLPAGGGLFLSPAKKGAPVGGVPWAMDNDAFNGGFNPDVFFNRLSTLEPHKDSCLFVVVPDVVGDAIQTLSLYRQWVRHFEGWPVAFVAQDGQENLLLPDYYDWLFVGGSTAWKMSPAALSVIARAKRDGKRVHVGRVNSIKRWNHFIIAGADSCDGTNDTMEPDRARIRWGRAMKQKPLFTGAYL